MHGKHSLLHLSTDARCPFQVTVRFEQLTPALTDG